MKRDLNESCLSAIFVDYDNIYLSLKRKSEEAAKRFAKDAASWIKEIETGRLISATNSPVLTAKRRIVMNRCYGNPVPRRNQSDNSTDMNSFPFVRHHFLRAGFEIVDCPPLTAQMKNSSDIRMVMDVRDYLTHDTYFDEFVILSGDADFTPVLHRLRAHARRTVVFANDFTAAPYTALSDGEVRESDLINLLLEGRLPSQADGTQPLAITASLQSGAIRKEIIAEVVANVKAASGAPVPLEVLADRAIRALGHDRTAGSNWAGAGSFRELLLEGLPEDVKLTDQPPYLAYEFRRLTPAAAPPAEALREERTIAQTVTAPAQPSLQAPPAERTVTGHAPYPGAQPFGQSATATATHAGIDTRAISGQGHGHGAPAPRQPRQPLLETQPLTAAHASTPAAGMQQQATHVQARPPGSLPVTSHAPAAPAPAAPAHAQMRAAAPPPPAETAPATRQADGASQLQQSIARIHEACQAPPLSPPEYRALFEVMAAEINEKGLQGGQTLSSIVNRSKQLGLDIRRDDVRFVLEVVSEADPWFEQGASAQLFAGRFRNFVVARCRSQGLNLSADELDLIEAWFSGGSVAGAGQQSRPAATAQGQSLPNSPIAAHMPAPQQQPVAPSAAQAYARAAQQSPAKLAEPRSDRWWNEDTATRAEAPARGAPLEQSIGQYQPGITEYQQQGDEFPRIVRTRLRN